MRTNDAATTAHLANQATTALEWGAEQFRCVRIQPAVRNPSDLLDPANWRSETWITGETDGTMLGVSACIDEAALGRYFSLLDKIDEGCVLVVMEAIEADVPDVDADQGALLVWPQRIISTTPLADTAIETLVEWARLEDEIREVGPERAEQISIRQDEIIDELIARYGRDQVNGWLGPVA